jgi:hypothetical protein
MPRNSIGEYSTTPGDNTDIGGINVAEGMAPSDVNNAMRELLSQLKEFQTGAGGDTISPPVLIATTATIGTATVTGAATFNSAVVMSSNLTINAQGDIRLADSDSSNWVAFQAPATVSSNVTWTLPAADGTNGQVLSTNGSGTLAFSNAASGDVVGPSSATDNAVTRFDGTTGKLIKNSTVTMDDSGNTNFADASVQRPKLLDYAVKGSALGNVGTAATIDFESANFFSATSTAATTWAFTNPVASGDFGAFVLELANGGAYTQAWPAEVDWPGGAAPTLTASGKDQLVFTTRDAGTTYLGFAAGLDIK